MGEFLVQSRKLETSLACRHSDRTNMVPSPAAFIAHKRDGLEHPPGDIATMIQSFLTGDFTDYQMAAWLMAVFLRGLSEAETIELTRAMLESGTRLSPSTSRPILPRVDKHSTGGVGDKISLPLAPLAAACGLLVPMIAGRGLGHTGGTLDKLESIPGFRVQLDAGRAARVLDSVGACIMGQTEEIAPADRRIYALRDVTATVAARPLIVASILSKKLAESLDGLVLDVKVGRGAFMTNAREARLLANDLVRVSHAMGTRAVARLTNMDRPLGRMIGNSLEVQESIDVLRGRGPADVTELTVALVAEMCVLGGVESSPARGVKRALHALTSGEALSRFTKMVELQGGDARVIDRPSRLPRAPVRLVVESARRGFVKDVDPLVLAHLALEMGAGRKKASDRIDFAVGIEMHVSRGDAVEKGDPLLTLHLRRRGPEWAARARAAVSVSSRRPESEALLLGRRVSST